VAAGALLALSVAGCETTEQKSAAIAKHLAHERANATTTKIAHASKTIRILSAQLVRGAGTAAALELQNTSGQARADVPIVITVTDASGKVLFTNATAGSDTPSGEIAFIGAHATAWWVDANVLVASGTPKSVSARIGDGVAAPRGVPGLSTADLSTGSNFVGPFISGRVLDDAQAASDVTLYAVALTGTRVLAAGQSLIPTLRSHGASSFQVSVIGAPKGGRLEATAVPEHLG
jgi:hypothetical protein